MFDVALILSLSLCPHFPVFTKLLGKRVFKRYLELFLDSPYFMDWWVIMTLEAIIYNIIQVCSKKLSVCVLCCNFNIDNVLQLFTCTHMHAHTNVWCNMLESHLTMSAAGKNDPQRENKTTQSNVSL